MTKEELNGIWNYYLTLETDLNNTSRYIEPAGQEEVHSFEFAKILILACTEIESVFKAICHEITGSEPEGNMGCYKEIILGNYPKIVNAMITIKRSERQLEPFHGWDAGKLKWWSAYQEVKHSRGKHFEQASYINAASAIAALYILIFYLAAISKISFDDVYSQYIYSDYSCRIYSVSPPKKLPDFEDDKKCPTSLS